MPPRRTVQTDSRALCYRELDVAGPSGAKLNAAGKSHEILRMGCGPPLISLKAGGLGLNLTAAEYVYILDPWWNPAVEAQAVDRTHRIGQQRPAFAYRLIARDTVEEKILELQNSKRDLAAEIIGAERNSVKRNLKPEDLALLLS